MGTLQLKNSPLTNCKMKEFFLNLLNSLDKLAGLRQVEKIMASSPNPKAEINELISVLIRVSEQFPYIPQKDQQNIISAAVVTDPEFNSLNARIVYKWLSAQRDKFFKESAHIPGEEDKDWVPVTGEARQEWLKKWERSLSGFDDREAIVKALPYAEVREIKKSVGNHKQATQEDLELSKLKIEYGRECCDLSTGRLKPGMPSFEDWLKTK